MRLVALTVALVEAFVVQGLLTVATSKLIGKTAPTGHRFRSERPQDSPGSSR
jgi:hypothetical protein